MTGHQTLENATGADLREPSGVAQYVALVVVATAVLQAIWIAVVPPFRGSDEFDHAYRAAGVAHGQWVATETPEDGRGLLVVAPESLVRAAHDQCDSLAYTGPDNCSPVEPLGDGLVVVASGAGGYHPAFYWVVGTLAEPYGGATALYVMRVVTALLCLLFVAMAAWAVGVRATSTWSRVGLVFAMTPVMLYSTAIVAPNGLEMAAALALWCALLGLGGSPDAHQGRRLLLIAFSSASVLMVGRTLGPLFALLIVLSVWLLHPSLVRQVATRHWRLLVSGSVVVLAAAAWAITWFVMNGAGRPAPTKQGGEWQWTSLLLWPLQAIAAFPFRDQPGALIVYPIVVLAFLALVLTALRVAGIRQRSAIAVALTLSVAVPLALTALTYEGRGAMWQGRYGLPYSMGVVLLASAVLDSRGWTTRLRPGLLMIGAAFLSAATAACFVKVLNSELRRPVSSMDTSWHAPQPWVVVGATLTAWGLYYVAVRWPRRGPV